MSEGSSPGLKLRLAALVVRSIIIILSATYRVRWISGRETMESLDGDSQPKIICVWHNRLLFFSTCLIKRLRRGFRVTIMISQSKDGDFGTLLGESVGADVVRGSASRGGSQGLRGMLRAVTKKRHSIYLLPDGSKGPLYKVKAGVIVLSKMAQAPILPISWSADRYWRVKSWDRMIIPKPFARIAVAVGDEMSVGRKVDEEQQEVHRIELENRLSEMRSETDAYFEKGMVKENEI